MKTDVLIIGGGVTGAAIAYELCKYNLDIMLVEKSSDVCQGTSKANSSMLHDGYNVDKNTLKGKLVLKADKEVYRKLCDELHVDLNFVGSILAGFEEKDMETVNHQLEMAKANGIQGMQVLNHDQMIEAEPNINPAVKFGLLNPNTGVMNPFELTMGMAENAVLNGVQVLLNTEVLDIKVNKDQKIDCVITNNGKIFPKVVINAAGLYSDKVAAMAEEIDFKIRPRRGQYFLYDKSWGDHVKHCIYSAPTPVSKGMIILPTTEGNILAGSNAEMLDDKTDFSTTAEALNHIYDATIHHIFPQLPRVGDVTTTFAGLRPAANTEDFIIGHAKTVTGMINVAGIQSPGLSSAPAVAEMVEGLVRELKDILDLDFSEKPNHIVGRPAPIRLNKLSNEERAELIKKRPEYGQIICRCESISRGEILDAIHRPIPALTMDAVKRRTRAGMGRCQGGFCGPRIVVDILSKELGVSPLDITKRGGASKILLDKAKELALKEGGEHRGKIEL